MSEEEPAWRAELETSIKTFDAYYTKEWLQILEPHILAAEQRGREAAWEKAADLAEETAAWLHRMYETEQSNGAYKVLEDLRREKP